MSEALEAARNACKTDRDGAKVYAMIALAEAAEAMVETVKRIADGMAEADRRTEERFETFSSFPNGRTVNLHAVPIATEETTGFRP